MKSSANRPQLVGDLERDESPEEEGMTATGSFDPWRGRIGKRL
jgi:hypothetical protein